jgi:putative ABC transport system permease protein
MRRRNILLSTMLRSLSRRRGQSITALVAITVAAAVTTALANLYVDVQAKLHHEFRSYGANIVMNMNPRPGSSLPPDSLSRIDSLLGGRGVAAPFAFAVARTAAGNPIVVAGTDMARVRRLDSWWSVSTWPTAPGTALVGAHAARIVDPNGDPFVVYFNEANLQITPAGILRTGGPEDDRIYLPLADFVSWTRVQPSIVEIAVAGSSAEVEAMVSRLSAEFPRAEVRPVRQIVEAEGRVFEKTRSTLLASVIVIVVTSFLCVLATLTASVLERRKDFAVMKALGASQHVTSLLFTLEAASLGAGGGILGYVFGIILANLIGRVNFHAAVSARWSLLPVIVLAMIAVTLFSALLPLALLRRLQPAAILKGE